MAFSPETYVLLNGKIKKLQSEVDELESATKWLGVTTTLITDGSSVNPITINGQSVTAESGNIVGYDNSEFIYNGTVWQEFGSGINDIELKYELISGDGGISTENEFEYNGYTYYMVAESADTLPDGFPEYSYARKFEMEMPHIPATVPPMIDKYDAYYNRVEVEIDPSIPPYVFDVLCIGDKNQSASDIIDHPKYLISIMDGEYALCLRSVNSQVPNWKINDIKTYQEIPVDYVPVENSDKLIASGGVYSSVDAVKKNIGYDNVETNLVTDYRGQDIDPCKFQYANIVDGVDGAGLKSITYEAKLTQYCNGYDYPWLPGSTKNLIDSDGHFIRPGESVVKGTPKSVPSGLYSFSVDIKENEGASGDVQIRDGHSNIIAQQTFSSDFSGRLTIEGFTNSSDRYLYCVVKNNSQDKSFGATRFMLESGSTATDFIPYYNICELGSSNEYFGFNISNGIWFGSKDLLYLDDWQYDEQSKCYSGTVGTFNDSFSNFFHESSYQPFLVLMKCKTQESGGSILKIYSDNAIAASFNISDETYTVIEYHGSGWLNKIEIESESVGTILNIEYFVITEDNDNVQAIWQTNSLPECYSDVRQLLLRFGVSDYIYGCYYSGDKFGNLGVITASNAYMGNLVFEKESNDNLFYTDDLADIIAIPDGEFGIDLRCTHFRPSTNQLDGDICYIAGSTSEYPGRVYFRPKNEIPDVATFISIVTDGSHGSSLVGNVSFYLAEPQEVSVNVSLSSNDELGHHSTSDMEKMSFFDGYSSLYETVYQSLATEVPLYESKWKIEYVPNAKLYARYEVPKKQDTLTFDSVPTLLSNNPVTSNGVKIAVDAKQQKIRKGTITLSTTWSGSDPGPYTQTVTVSPVSTSPIQVTSDSEIQLRPTIEQIESLAEDGVTAIEIINNSGILTAKASGGTNSVSMVIDCDVVEVE